MPPILLHVGVSQEHFVELRKDNEPVLYLALLFLVVEKTLHFLSCFCGMYGVLNQRQCCFQYELGRLSLNSSNYTWIWLLGEYQICLQIQCSNIDYGLLPWRKLMLCRKKCTCVFKKEEDKSGLPGFHVSSLKPYYTLFYRNEDLTSGPYKQLDP